MVDIVIYILRERETDRQTERDRERETDRERENKEERMLTVIMTPAVTSSTQRVSL